MGLLARKTVLVTGVSGRLGDRVCEAFQQAGAFQETPPETCAGMLALHVRTAFLLFRETLPPMIRLRSTRLTAAGSRAEAADRAAPISL